MFNEYRFKHLIDEMKDTEFRNHPFHKFSEDENEYIGTFVVPGNNKDTLSIDIINDELIIKSSQNKKTPNVDLKYRIHMKGVNYKNINAKCKDGILTVIFPKKKNIQSKILIE